MEQITIVADEDSAIDSGVRDLPFLWTSICNRTNRVYLQRAKQDASSSLESPHISSLERQ